jgi:hypothetical protein
MKEQVNVTGVDVVYKIIGALNWPGEKRSPVALKNILQEDAKMAQMVEKANKILANRTAKDEAI